MLVRAQETVCKHGYKKELLTKYIPRSSTLQRHKILLPNPDMLGLSYLGISPILPDPCRSEFIFAAEFEAGTPAISRKRAPNDFESPRVCSPSVELRGGRLPAELNGGLRSLPADCGGEGTSVLKGLYRGL